ncbi:MAG: glycosyltransferase family 2 protein [Lachnospiraceae bacterium]|nr:glycosyltransferase family 2 protein [Lachnospiraceae bacterium]
MPLVSVIVPVYKVEQYIESCLDAVKSQTYENLEIILIDDGTPDSSGEICERYAEQDSRMVVYHKQNGGLSDARNYGIDCAKGEYITFIDSDDRVDIDYVEYLYRLIRKYECMLALCTHRILYENGKMVEIGAGGEEILDEETCLERMLYHDVIDTSAWAKLYHRKILEGIRFPKGKLFEDIGTVYKTFLKSKKIACGYSPKYTYVFHDDSIVNGAFSIKKLDLLDMTDQMAKEVAMAYPSLEKAVNRRKVYARFSTLNQMMNCRAYKKEKTILIKYIRKHGLGILADKKAPKRDHAAILLLMMNYGLYCLAWNVIRKSRGL